MVEPVPVTRREQRQQALAGASYNTSKLRSEDVYIDLLAHSGASAMSDRRWAGMMPGNEAYAGKRNCCNLENAAHDSTGGCWISPKKDSLVNLGVWLAVSDWTLCEGLRKQQEQLDAPA